MLALRAYRGASSRALRTLCTYQRLDAVEHTRRRPEMYVGTTSLVVGEMHWVLEDAKTGRLVLRCVEYVPAVLKVFDEILVNALDARTRSSYTNRIDVTIDEARGAFTIVNNGPGIDVRKHETEGIWIPELVMGHMHAGSNFDDETSRTVGGRHGFGAKLANIFSTEFHLETVDKERSLHYSQTWRDNMAVCEAPVVRKAIQAEAGGLTRVSVVLDLPRLGMPAGGLLGSDTARLMRRRVADAAALAGERITVTLDGARLPARKWVEYVRACAHALQPPIAVASQPAIHVEAVELVVNKHPWQLAVALAPAGDGASAQLSFVNGVHTSRGGTHVSAVSDALCKLVALQLAMAAPPDAAGAVTPALVRAHLFVALAAVVENPTFNTQGKEELVTTASALIGKAGVKPLSGKDGFLSLICTNFQRKLSRLPGLADAVYSAAAARSAAAASRSGKASGRTSRPHVDKLEDAQLAGGKLAHECTLILTEGDSAKALAVAGLEVIGRDRYGVLPLRGKLLNVRTSSRLKTLSNLEITALCKTLGVQPSDGPAALEAKLRYGRLLLMTDQDHDGSHIKGLVLNLVHRLWPHLLTRGDFVGQFITPIIKVRPRGSAAAAEADGAAGAARGAGKGKGAAAATDGASKGGPISFYSMDEFEAWRSSLEATAAAAAAAAAGSPTHAEPAAASAKYNVKYYKGLGTSTSAEAREYFRALDLHVKRMLWGGEGDAEQIDMAFGKRRSEDRRAWILRAALSHATTAAATAAPATAVTAATAAATATAATAIAATLAPATAVAVLASAPVARLPGAGAGSIGEHTIGQFIEHELAQFSLADCVRSIPSVLDGLKPSQRKVLHACFRRRMGVGAESEMKVAQLAGYVAETTGYHHGEASLVKTIVAMAQGYVGANAVPLLEGVGQFGTRARGGEDAAAARYIYVRMGGLTRLLFPAADDALLPRAEVEGELVEPLTFVPVVPLVLLNGASGIGTGWSSDVPSFHPLQLLANARVLASLGADAPRADAARALGPMGLWSAGFDGRFGPFMEREGRTMGPRALCLGAARATATALKKGGSAHEVVVSELPLGCWTEEYKRFLLALEKDNRIGGFTEAHTEARVHFTLTLTSAQRDALETIALPRRAAELRGGWPDSGTIPDAQLALLANLKLTSYISLRNMHLFAADGAVARYDSSAQILLDHADARRQLYAARKQHEIGKLAADELSLANRARFVTLVNAGRVRVLGAPRDALESTLGELGFAREAELRAAAGAADDEPESGRGRLAREDADGAYNYLLRMPLRELTAERVERLQAQHAECVRALEEVRARSERQMWERELDMLQEPFELLASSSKTASSGVL